MYQKLFAVPADITLVDVAIDIFIRPIGIPPSIVSTRLTYLVT